MPESSFFLFGARGTGKSTWLRHHFPGALYIDLLEEGRYQRYLVDPEQFALDVGTVNQGAWIVVDEVQRLPQLLNEVHRVIELRGCNFALSGSSARKLKTATTNLLAGRAINKSLHPFLPHELGSDFSITDALRTGTIPVIWTSREKAATLESYAQRYLREEIQAEALVRNLPSFARFLPVAAILHSQLLSISAIARDSEVHRNTVSNYIDILEDTLIAFRLSGYEAKLRVKERKNPKLYFIDAGLVRALKRYSGEVLEEEKGALFEGWVANTLRSYNAYRPFFDDWYYWSASDTKLEVDFLLRRNKEFVAVEVKSSRKIIKQDLNGLKAIADLPGLKRRMIVYLGTQRQRTESAIDILPVGDFISSLSAGLFES